MRTIRMLTIGALAGASTLAALAGPVLAGPAQAVGLKIGPNQAFTALVNAKPGSSAPVVIKMGCFGPLQPGQTGHPMKGQTLTVSPAATVAGPGGNTGPQGDQIGAFFGAPPPGATGSSGPVFFTHYRTKPLPTSTVLPCAGHGNVLFVPLPVTGGRDVVVHVVYVGQP